MLKKHYKRLHDTRNMVKRPSNIEIYTSPFKLDVHGSNGLNTFPHAPTSHLIKRGSFPYCRFFVQPTLLCDEDVLEVNDHS